MLLAYLFGGGRRCRNQRQLHRRRRCGGFCRRRDCRSRDEDDGGVGGAFRGSDLRGAAHGGWGGGGRQGHHCGVKMAEGMLTRTQSDCDFQRILLRQQFMAEVCVPCSQEEKRMFFGGGVC